MILSRDLTNRLNWMLDNLVPPVIRDSRCLMRLLFRIVLKGKCDHFMAFKEKAYVMSKEELNEYYRVLSSVHLNRKTDLNELCLNRILDSAVGENALDIACGRGFMARELSEKRGLRVTGVDFNVSEKLKKDSRVTFLEGDIENIAFPEAHFDTVICAHTLEHVRDFEKAVSELRRVTRRRLIVVVPRQREYRYTFDLHLHFFPYPYSLRRAMKNASAEICVLGNDLFYIENA